MFKEKYQTKLFSIFNSSGSGPLEGWVPHNGCGSIQPAKDDELRTHVLDIQSPNVATTFISTPPPPHTSLGLGMRCLTMVVKYFDQPFSFEVQVLDAEDMRRRFRFSTYNRQMKLTTFVTSMGLALVPGWNIVQLDLAQFTDRAYGTMYLETLNVTVHANCRLRRIYFSDKLYTDADLPADYRLLATPAPAEKQEAKEEIQEGKTVLKQGRKQITQATSTPSCFPTFNPQTPPAYSFHNGSYGSLPDHVGRDSPSAESTHKVIFCVHGKPNGCCATVINDSSKPVSSTDMPQDTITIMDEHCHRDSVQNRVDRRARKKLIIASILCLVFMIFECIGGYLSSSLAIATDAAHLLTDFAAFMISLFALWVSSRKPTQSMPFGWYRAEVIGALTSVLTIWVVTGILVYMAVERIVNRQFEIDAKIMLITSGFGVLVNIIMGFTLHQHGHTHGGGGGSHSHEAENINVRAAFIHVLGDFLQSAGVFCAALFIFFYPEWAIVDPICTFLFSIVVLCTTMAIMKDTLNVLMEGMPRGVDFNDVLNTFLSIDGVQRVHNLRIWALSLDKIALAAHLAIAPGVNSHDILKTASRKIHSKFNFFEMTLQIEDFHEAMKDCTQCQCPEK